LENHEKSKKHKENVAVLKEEVLLEEEIEKFLQQSDAVDHLASQAVPPTLPSPGPADTSVIEKEDEIEGDKEDTTPMDASQVEQILAQLRQTHPPATTATTSEKASQAAPAASSSTIEAVDEGDDDESDDEDDGDDDDMPMNNRFGGMNNFALLNEGGAEDVEEENDEDYVLSSMLRGQMSNSQKKQQQKQQKKTRQKEEEVEARKKEIEEMRQVRWGLLKILQKKKANEKCRILKEMIVTMNQSW